MEQHIAETLISVQSQTLDSWEAIVVDDCSTDSTPQIVNEFVEQDPRIRYYRLPENSNLPAVPRNYGIQQAHGKYVALLDHDDAWNPRKLQRQVQVLEADESLAMVHSHLWVRRNGRSFPGLFYLPSPRQSVATESKLKKNNVIQCSSVVIRKAVVQGLGGFDESLKLRAVEDYHLWFRVSQHHRIVFISEIHGEYRLDRAGTSARENMQNRLWEIDQSIGTDSFASQRSRLHKIVEKALSFPSALFYLAIEGRYRQRFDAPPRSW
ncbi:glycosyltransferase family 2 protein [bacterium]|nr:glycosyltransferase family 2 protein [bacterium]